MNNNWSNEWATPTAIAPVSEPPKQFNPWDHMTQDELLVRHQQLKDALDKAKADEMELRKYIVNRAFPNKVEGTNTLELGNGYELKAGIKFNYKLLDNKVVDDCLDRISKIGNQGSFVAERLVSWTPNFLLTEYRELQEHAKEGHLEAQTILKITNEMLDITDAAPTLTIKEPKGKKK